MTFNNISSLHFPSTHPINHPLLPPRYPPGTRIEAISKCPVLTQQRLHDTLPPTIPQKSSLFPHSPIHSFHKSPPPSPILLFHSTQYMPLCVLGMRRWQGKSKAYINCIQSPSPSRSSVPSHSFHLPLFLINLPGQISYDFRYT